MEIKRCARCGGFFGTSEAVCDNCMEKDNKELGKLKNYLSGYYDCSEPTITKNDVSASTGITMKNLNRFLLGEEFAGYNIPASLENINEKKIIEEV